MEKRMTEKELKKILWENGYITERRLNILSVYDKKFLNLLATVEIDESGYKNDSDDPILESILKQYNDSKLPEFHRGEIR